MIWPFLLIYIKGQVNLPLSTITILTTINATSGLISALLAGPITDRLGRKWVLVFSLIGNGLVYLFMSQASTLPAFAILMAFSGIFNPVYRVSSDAMLADLIPPDRRPDAYALLRLSNNAGISLGPSMGGLLTVLSYSVAFYFAAGGLILYGLLLTFLAYENSSTANYRSSFYPYLSGLLRCAARSSLPIICKHIHSCANERGSDVGLVASLRTRPISDSRKSVRVDSNDQRTHGSIFPGLCHQDNTEIPGFAGDGCRFPPLRLRGWKCRTWRRLYCFLVINGHNDGGRVDFNANRLNLCSPSCPRRHARALYEHIRSYLEYRLRDCSPRWWVLE